MSNTKQATVNEEIYRLRFSEEQTSTRQLVWEIVTKQFLQRYVRPTDTVLDIGAGDGWFLRNIKAARKIALDLNPQIAELRQYGIETFNAKADDLTGVLESKVDVILLSNFLEHLPNKQALFDVLRECRGALTPGGRLLILQPNVRYVGAAYWDYIDHHIALTDRSLVEALEVHGYVVDEVIPQFLPYTVKSRSGSFIRGEIGKKIVSLYLKLPWLWRIFGGQTFVVARS